LKDRFHFGEGGNKQTETMSTAAPANKLLLVILAILLPPLAVGMKSGIGKSFVINLILTILFWIPGVIHALIVIL
jgi:uncharacterized membrane protein YqaE (UPF0057 family)